MEPPDHYVNCETWRRINASLTFRIDYFFRAICILTMHGTKPHADPTAEKLRSMIQELASHGIVGRKRINSWMHWHDETAWFVFSCVPKSRVEDARAEWEWITRRGGEFADVAGAVYDLLSEVQGPQTRVFSQRGAEELVRMMDMLSQPWSTRADRT